MKKHILFSLVSCIGLSTAAFAADAPGGVGVVNFVTCVTDSKVGKQEQSSFEALKKQLVSLLEDTEKQLTDISTKLNDKEYLDGLSPEGEDELKTKFRTLNEELGRYQNQYYQVLNQANMKLVQVMSTNINNASEKVAKEKRLSVVINKDACFFYSNQLDVTPFVVAEMDKNFIAATTPATGAAPQAEAVKSAPAAVAAQPAEAVKSAPAAVAAQPADAVKSAPAVVAAPQAEAATTPVAAEKVEAKAPAAPVAAEKKETAAKQASAIASEKVEVKAKKDEAKKR